MKQQLDLQAFLGNARRLRTAVFVFATLIGLLNFGVIISHDLANGREPEFAKALLDEISGVWSLLTLLPLMIRAMLRWPVRRPYIASRLFLHLLLSAAFGLAQTLLMYGSRTILYILLDWGQYQFGRFIFAALMEYNKQILAYLLIYGITHFIDSLRRNARAREQAAQLSRELSQTRLQMLQMQLNPHFLFNTLNIISATMYDDIQSADRMMTRLGDLLRATLREKPGLMHSLQEEIELIRSYSSLMQARFGERLDIEIDIEPACRHRLVPLFIVQPLLENAITYTMDAHGTARVVLTAQTNGDELILQISDDGPGIGDPAKIENSNGIGIRNVHTRLQVLFDRDDLLQLGQSASGGLQLTILIPVANTSSKRETEDKDVS